VYPKPMTTFCPVLLRPYAQIFTRYAHTENPCVMMLTPFFTVLLCLYAQILTRFVRSHGEPVAAYLGGPV
jgi:ABC-type uncharacterized transport system permease subunit